MRAVEDINKRFDQLAFKATLNEVISRMGRLDKKIYSTNDFLLKNVSVLEKQKWRLQSSAEIGAKNEREIRWIADALLGGRAFITQYLVNDKADSKILHYLHGITGP
jgi:hypothetical protein